MEMGKVRLYHLALLKKDGRFALVTDQLAIASRKPDHFNVLKILRQFYCVNNLPFIQACQHF
jgi:hypothetical protein